jgi:hypothetical protein
MVVAALNSLEFLVFWFVLECKTISTRYRVFKTLVI